MLRPASVAGSGLASLSARLISLAVLPPPTPTPPTAGRRVGGLDVCGGVGRPPPDGCMLASPRPHLQLTRLFVWRRWKSPPGVQTLDASRSKRWRGGGPVGGGGSREQPQPRQNFSPIKKPFWIIKMLNLDVISPILCPGVSLP